MRKFLSIVMLLSGLMPLVLGFVCVVSYSTALSVLKFTECPDMFQAVTMFGVCVGALGVLQLLGAAWVWRGNPAGVVLSRYAGVLILITGTVLTLVIHRPDLGLVDMGKGVLILALAFLVKRQ